MRGLWVRKTDKPPFGPNETAYREWFFGTQPDGAENLVTHLCLGDGVDPENPEDRERIFAEILKIDRPLKSMS